MPHIILELSKNISDQVDLRRIGKIFHEDFLSVSDSFKLQTLRTKVVIDDHYIGDGNPQNCFAHAIVELVAGRADEIKTNLVSKLISTLESEFDKAVRAGKCLISVELREINPNIFKYSDSSAL